MINNPARFVLYLYITTIIHHYVYSSCSECLYTLHNTCQVRRYFCQDCLLHNQNVQMGRIYFLYQCVKQRILHIIILKLQLILYQSIKGIFNMWLTFFFGMFLRLSRFKKIFLLGICGTFHTSYPTQMSYNTSIFSFLSIHTFHFVGACSSFVVLIETKRNIKLENNSY